MNTLPAIFKLEEADYSLYRDFLHECIEYSLPATAAYLAPPSEKSKEAFYNWLQSSTVFICNRNSRNIGFVVIATSDSDIDPVMNVTFFVHPKVCKLATITVARAAAVLAHCEMSSNNLSRFMSSTIHTLVYTVFASFFDIKPLKHGNMYYISCMSNLERMMNNLKSNYEQDEVKSYFEMYNLTY